MTHPLQFDYDSSEGEYIATFTAPNGDVYRVRMVQDDYSESPREWDNLCTMACEHRRYNLGDDDGLSRAASAIRASRFYRDSWEDGTIRDSYSFTYQGETHDTLDLSDGPDVWKALQWCDDIISAPLYLFDHSGISISTGSFSCPWDSGQIGFAFVTLDDVARAGFARRWTAKRKQWARDVIDGGTEIYDSYLRGDVYGYICERATEWDDGEPSEWDAIDDGSCWGYYGDSHDSGLADSAMDAIRYDIEKRRAERAAKLATLIRNRVPLAQRAAILESV